MSTKTPSPVDIAIGARVRAARVGINLSQEKLAAALGVTFQQVQKYERGVNRIAAGRLGTVAGALGVTIAHLLGTEGGDPPTGEGSWITSAPALRLARAYDHIPDGPLKRSLHDAVLAAAEPARALAPVEA